MNYYTKSQLADSDINDEDLLNTLKTSWGFEPNEPIEVLCELKGNKSSEGFTHYRVYNVKSVKDMHILTYPISDLVPKDDIPSDGIYVGPSFDNKIKSFLNKNGKILVACSLELSDKSERIKHDNPLLVNVTPSSIKVYTTIDESFLIRDNEKILINESVYNSIEFKYQKEIKRFENQIKEHEKKLSQELTKLDEEFESKQNEVTLQIEELSKKYSTEEEKLQKKIDVQEKTLKRLEENKLLVINEIKEKQQEKSQLISLIDELKIELERIEETMAKKLEKFRSFIKEKAEQLKNLEFIDEEEYNDLMMIKKENQEENGEPVKSISFKDDLDLDYQKAISHIHSYLFNQDIIYPRYIIEDFMALIQTNDLIVLAGESGSGKTNLIKSFAKAIGGKSFIIPVKPNWTSAEDLLGYYNPLEKKYLSTPFLEALLEAKNNPEVPYFICLDEMNLARVEYYFADFLSLLEERDGEPEIHLYSDSESSHVLSEFKNVLELIESIKEKYQKNNLVDFVSILKDEEVNNELKRVFGFSDKDSLIKYHTDLRKMISGLINIPSSIKFPKNVRIIGAINIDETTHYLSPKILDRAHIMKFDSPLLYDWTAVAEEIEENDRNDHILKFNLIELGVRQPYPSFDKDDNFCSTIVNFTKKYFSPMGIEVGLRTIRQGLNYQKIFIGQGSDERFVMNNFILHKILPKMTFDSSKEIGENTKKIDLLINFGIDIKNEIGNDLVSSKSINIVDELRELVKSAQKNNGIVNYWA
ncbi:MAG: AAA family ATPase [Campylobacterales bacterium]|nr:AAA family ATPase [Campylobacterales bacterium]